MSSRYVILYHNDLEPTSLTHALLHLKDFAEAKRREMAEDAPKEVDTTLPGWVRQTPSSFTCASQLTVSSAGLVGWYRHEESRAEAAPDQEGRGHRPQVARGLQEGARDHLREARQEGGQVPRQGPAVSIHEQGPVRAQHGGAARHGVEHAPRLPKGDAAQGRHQGAFLIALRCTLRKIANDFFL